VYIYQNIRIYCCGEYPQVFIQDELLAANKLGGLSQVKGYKTLYTVCTHNGLGSPDGVWKLRGMKTIFDVER